MIQTDNRHFALPLAANQRLKADYAETDIVVKQENKGATGPLWYYWPRRPNPAPVSAERASGPISSIGRPSWFLR